MVREFLVLGNDPRFNSFLDEFQSETDRAAAVLGAAYLDSQLKDLLLRSWTTAIERYAKLVEHPGPVSTFSSRITLAAALGLIAEDERIALDAIRNIRNDFAHKLAGDEFEPLRAFENCRSLELIRERFREEPGLATAYLGASPRKHFDLLVALLGYYLHRRGAHAARFAGPKPALWPDFDLGGEVRTPEVAG